jgi:hypothetical protein
MWTSNSQEVQLSLMLADFLKVVFGGVVAAWISLWVAGRRLDQDRLSAARQLAIRLIDIFERYAVGCGDTINENRNSQRESPYDYKSIARLPNLGDLPDDDAGWRALEPSFAIDARTFGNKISGALSIIREEGEYGDADSIAEEIDKQAVSLGSSAWQMTTLLRKKYKLPVSNPPYDLDAHFSVERDKHEKAQAERKKENEEWWAEQIASDSLQGDSDTDTSNP